MTRFAAGLAAVFAALVAGFGRVIGWDFASAVIAVLAAVMVYYVILFRLLSRGWFRPWIQPLNVALEVSIPSVIFLLATRLRAPELALSSPAILAWGILTILSALRLQPLLCVAAGGLAATEFLALYFWRIWPLLPRDAPSAYSPQFAVLRAFLLFSTGLATWLVASFLVQKAREVISAVRARDLFGKYILHERLGAGGMAEVFRATYSPEGGFEKQVAVKRILPAYALDEQFVTLFRREAELCSLLNHPNIVQVFDMGRFNETYFLAMEFVEGMSLQALLRARASGLPLNVVAYVGAELAAALEYLHGRRSARGEPLRLVHRDVNPPNILVSLLGEVKLGDFGVAHSKLGAALTVPGGVRGKAGYMAPEQARGEAIDGRTDLFGLGLTLHELLTGAPLLEGENEIQRMRAAFEQPLLPPSARRPDVPPQLDGIIMALLAREPDQRIHSAGQLRENLLRLPPEVAPYPEGQRALMAALSEAQAQRPPDVQEDVSAPTLMRR